MNGFRSYITRGSSLRGRASSLQRGERGNALLYVMLAVGLMAALTFAYVQDTRENSSAQSSVQIAESLLSQVNMIKAAIVQCSLEYPGGMDPSFSPPNPPYPLAPNSALNPHAPAGIAATSGVGANDVMNLTCVGAPLASAYMFQGANNQGRFLPPPAAGITPAGAGSGWTYGNDTSFGGLGGVYIQTTSSGDAASAQALSRLATQFTTKQYTLSGLTFTAWVQNNN